MPKFVQVWFLFITFWNTSKTKALVKKREILNLVQSVKSYFMDVVLYVIYYVVSCFVYFEINEL